MKSPYLFNFLNFLSSQWAENLSSFQHKQWALMFEFCWYSSFYLCIYHNYSLKSTSLKILSLLYFLSHQQHYLFFDVIGLHHRPGLFSLYLKFGHFYWINLFSQSLFVSLIDFLAKFIFQILSLTNYYYRVRVSSVWIWDQLGNRLLFFKKQFVHFSCTRLLYHYLRVYSKHRP